MGEAVTVAALGAVLGRMSAILDVTVPHSTVKELHWERVGKLPEEAGEVFTAFLGWLGSNPRKGRTNEVDAVCDELLDVAVTALGAWEHLTGNRGGSGEALAGHAASKAGRLEGFVPLFALGERVRVRRGSWAADATVTGVRFDQFDVPWMVDVQTDGGGVFAAHPLEVVSMTSSVIDEIGDVPVVFWTCPDRTHRHVTWEHRPDRSIATCAVCGATSALTVPPGDGRAARLDGCMNDTTITVFPVMYRDADNYKRHSTIVVAGTFTDEQIEALRATLDQGELYAPADVGLPHLLDDSPWSQTDKDHCWHEMDVDDHDVLPPPAGATVQFESPSAMIEQFAAASAAGWPDQTSDRWA